MGNQRFWNIPVPEELDDRLERAVEVDSHISKAEFIRDATRRLLEELEGRKR